MNHAAPQEAELTERPIGVEARKTFELKLRNGFIDRYLAGPAILDIGYKGYESDVVPILPHAIGIDLDYPGYDGDRLPFADGSQDAVFSSHCLEHIANYRQALREWFRVLKPGGHLVIVVPHQFLYEKRTGLPSRWNEDHKRFYTPALLMSEIETALPPNTYRLRHLADNDLGYDYSIGPDRHAGGCYEIELVIQKIPPPQWALEIPPPLRAKPAAIPPASRMAISRLRRAVGRWLPAPAKAVLRRIV